MPPSRSVFFLDRSVGKHLVASALRRAGAEVELHDDHFRRDADDQDWIVEVSRRGWSVITKDTRIRYRPLELAAVSAAEARLFVLTAGNASGSEMAEILVMHLAKMKRISIREPAPFIARVSRSRIVVKRLRRR